MEKALSGGCLCGDIRFLAISPRNIHSCSCDICQKHTGAQTAVWLEFSAENVEWIGKGGNLQSTGHLIIRAEHFVLSVVAHWGLLMMNLQLHY